MYDIGEKIIQAVTFGLCVWFARDSLTESWFAKVTPTWREKSIKLYLFLITLIRITTDWQ